MMLVMLLSGLPLSSYATASPAGVLTGADISTHGPYLNEIDYTVISTDSTLYSSLASGTIQGPEWALSTGSFFSAVSNPNLYANSTVAGQFDYLSFNELRPITNSTHFRQAIQYLTDYGFIQGTICAGVACVGSPEFEYSGLFPNAANPSAYSWVTFSLAKAAAELKLSGLTMGNTTDVPASQITWLYKGVQWTPTMYYRIDDPLRTAIAEHLVYEASLIGLQFNAKGVTSQQISVNVYGPSPLGVIKPGVYDSATGYNTAPVFNYTVAQNGQPDSWDMYTGLWLGLGATGFDYDWSFLNSANVGTQNFLNYYNRSMDYYTNQVKYATSIAAAAQAAQEAELVFAQNLPYVVAFWPTQLYAVYLSGWTGYSDWPTSGPVAYPGTYWTFLNLHPSNQPTGGTYTFALHQVPDGGFGLNPLYYNNWNWQIDIWQSMYDTALKENPANLVLGLPNLGWMGSYDVSSFTGSTGSGPGWFEFQTAHGPQKISSGQVITFNFDKNITFFDHVPFTAYDYNYSLYVFNTAGNLPDNDNPWGRTLSGSNGLIATYVPPNNKYQIQVYINSSSIWNLQSFGTVTIFPQHIWKYFNADLVSSASKTLDITLPYTKAAAACSCTTTGLTPPTWLKDLYNLGVSNGPFELKTYDPTTGSTVLVKNVNYFRTPWWAGAPTAMTNSIYTFSTKINESIYNSGTSTLGGVAAGSNGVVPIANATGTVTLLLNNKQVGTPIPMTAGSGGVYTASIPTSSLSPGTYELVVNATYTFLGLPRVWYQAAGLQVTSGGTTTTTTSSASHTTTTTSSASHTTTTSQPTSISTSSSSSSTTSSVDYTPYIYSGIIVVAIILIIAVALAMRRGRGGK
jgi:Bacterial extracellular solute-binding proteins, family 5 Middle